MIAVRSRVLVQRFAEDQRKIERRGVAATRALSARIRSRAVRSFRDRGDVSLSHQIVTTLLPTVVDAMVLAYMQGIKREREIVQRATGLRLDTVFDKSVSVLSRQLKMDLPKLQRRYRTHAFRVLNGVASSTERKLRETVFELTQEGAHVREAVTVLGERFDELGLTRAADYRLEAIFRTQTQIAYNAGRWQVDQDPAVQEILWGYQYSAVGDDRTREAHLALDGMTLPKDDARWQKLWPPNGWNCRCSPIPVFDPEEPVEPRAMSDGSDAAPDDGFDWNPGVVFGDDKAVRRLRLSWN